MGRRVRVVVLNYNGGDHVVRCVDALAALDLRGHQDDVEAHEIEIVVIDNASTDGSVEAVLDRHPAVGLIQTGSNLGFVANNLGLRDLGDVDYVALVNNDAFVEPGWLTPLVDALDVDPGLGAVQSKILFADRFVEIEMRAPADPAGRFDAREFGVQVHGVRVDGRDESGEFHLVDGADLRWTGAESIVRVPVVGELGPWQVELSLSADRDKIVQLRPAAVDEGHMVEEAVGPDAHWVSVTVAGEPESVVNNVGTWLTVDGSGADRGWLEVDRGQYHRPAEIFAWCGAAVMLRPAYLDDVGLFDERLFLYYEDLDLAWRGRAQGWRYDLVPTSVVRHLHAASSGPSSRAFRFHNERNRLVVLVKNGPFMFACRSVLRHPLSTLSYLRRDVIGRLLDRRRPDWSIVRVRLAAEASFLRLLPGTMAQRRRLRRRRIHPTADFESWVGRPDGPR